MTAPTARWFAVTALLLSSCARDTNSAFAPVGPQSGRMYDMFLVLVVVNGMVWLVVTSLWLLGMWRRRRSEPSIDEASERRMYRVVTGALITTVVILLSFLLVEMGTSRAIGASLDENPIDIGVVGHQWWWEVHYEDAIPSRAVITANEIHVPVGQPVRLKLSSNDVIHSFWAPNVHGKIDLIPGHATSLRFRVDRPGVYRGKCAEFCGFQHAKMDFLVIAEPPAQYRAWLAGQRNPAVNPTDSVRLRGQEVFLAGTCVMCHTIRGTPAGGRVGPDLTHLASRRTIAAGALPNRRGYLGGWIVDPQSIKPGVRMPANPFPAQDLQALLEYLESLK
jgi:cytochrome c oxidase subunit II